MFVLSDTNMNAEEEKKYRHLKVAMVTLFSVLFLLGLMSRGNQVQNQIDTVNDKFKLDNTAENDSDNQIEENADGEWGVAYLESLDVEDGIDIKTRRELGEKLRDDPNNHELHNEMGIALAKDGLLSEAMMHFFEAVELSPGSASAFYNIGTVYEFMDEYDTAQIYIEKANKLEPENKQTLKTLNRIEFVLEYRPEGHDKYQADLNKALMAMGKGCTDLDYANSILEGLVVENPSAIEALNALGVVKARRGVTDEAERIFNQIIYDEPGYIFAYVNLVTVYESQRKYSKALEFLNKARNLADDRASIKELDKRIKKFETKYEDYLENGINRQTSERQP